MKSIMKFLLILSSLMFTYMVMSGPKENEIDRYATNSIQEIKILNANEFEISENNQEIPHRLYSCKFPSIDYVPCSSAVANQIEAENFLMEMVSNHKFLVVPILDENGNEIRGPGNATMSTLYIKDDDETYSDYCDIANEHIPETMEYQCNE